MLFHCEWPEKKKQPFFYTSRIWSWQEHPHLTDEKNQGANEFGSFPRDVQDVQDVARPGCELQSVPSEACSSHGTSHPFSSCSHTSVDSVKEACLEPPWAHRPSMKAATGHGNKISRKTPHSWPFCERKTRETPDLAFGNQQLAAPLSREDQSVLYQ